MNARPALIRDRFTDVFGYRRGAERPEDRLRVVVSCPELGIAPLCLRGARPVLHARVLAAAVEHFDVRDRPVSLRLAAGNGSPLPPLAGIPLGGRREPAELLLLPGVGDEGHDWWHREGHEDHPELVACLERWEADAWMVRVRLIAPPYGDGWVVAAMLRADGHGQPEEYPVSYDELVWLRRAWPLWLRATGRMTAT